jgi:hypothetical protein
VLHVFEAIPYVMAPWLCRKIPKVGYALAFAAGAFWILCAGFLTTFIRNGFERVVEFVETGRVDRPDILLSVPGFMGTFGLVVFGLLGYWQLQDKRGSDFFLFAGMFIAILLFFLLIFFLFTPQYLGMFRQLI